MASPPQTSVGFRWGTRLRPDRTNMDRVVDLHPGHRVRRVCAWSGCQSGPGATYTWGNMPTIVANAQAAGIPLLFVLSQTPAWANPVSAGGTGNTGNYYPASHVADFVDFCVAAVERFPYVRDWEIQNEPDIRNWTPDEVKEVLVRSYEAMKARDPGIKVGGLVIGCAPSQHTHQSASWYDTLLRDPEVRASMDAMTWHCYECPGEPEVGNPHTPPKIGIHTKIEQSLALPSMQGWTPEIWITEGGWPTEFPGDGREPWDGNNKKSDTTDADQARWLPWKAIMMMAYPQVTRFYQFQLYGHVTSGDREGGMGMISSTGVDKPSFQAWKTMCSIFDEDLLSVTAVQKGPQVYIYRFDKTGGRYGYALRRIASSAEQHHTLVGLPGSTVRVTYLFGERMEIPTVEGSVIVPVDLDPLYVEAVW